MRPIPLVVHSSKIMSGSSRSLPRFRMTQTQPPRVEAISLLVKLLQNFGVFLIHRQQAVTGIAVLRNVLTCLGLVASVLAAKAPGGVGVADIARVRPPG